ncbi:MAG: hypothetical protein K8E66_13985, partial [Phycisphaerales bacterium]|nr:hypothetical protein [Phycisphaerales bacterium]
MLTIKHAATIAAVAGFAAAASAQTDIFWNAGSSNWITAANWNPVNVPNAITENAHILGPAGINVNLDTTVSINDLNVGSDLTLTLDPVRGLHLNGGLTNTGLITLNPTISGNNSFIQFLNNATISGSGGVLRLAGGGDDAQLLTALDVTVTNASGHT